MEFYKAVGISNVCKKLLNEKKDWKKRCVDARAELTSKMQRWRHEYILNLKAAASANGQLIAAVLEEEDGLTTDQIGSWCEELEMLSSDALDSLLHELCLERIIKRDNEGKYHLRYILNEDLKAVPETEWIKKELKLDELEENYKYLLDLLYCAESGLTVDHILDHHIDEHFYPITMGEYSDDVKNMSEIQVSAYLRWLNLNGYIRRYDASNGASVYYYPLLGSKEDQEA